MGRCTPKIKTDVTKGYAALLGHNWDTVQESYNMVIPPVLAERLEFHKQMAGEKESPVEFSFGGELFHIWMGASQGKKWVIESDDLQIHFGSPKQKWPVTVRYLSGGLWEHGFCALKERVLNMLLKEAIPLGEQAVLDKPDTWQRVSRADYAFDFYSPQFSQEMASRRIREKLVLPSGVKVGAIGTSLRDETLTVGLNRAGLVIQVYDKGKEIDDMSGKTWMFKVWEREGYFPPDEKRARDVWRVEVRFGKDFIKSRGILGFQQVQELIDKLLAEALCTRRMVVPSDIEAHRERWPLHPLWAAAYEASGRAGEYLPIGRQITLRRDAMLHCLEMQSRGLARSRSVVATGGYDQKIVNHLLESDTEEITKDREHAAKVEKAQVRYHDIGEAK